ncbi:hypothetical protein SAMN05216345_1442 [Cupriavidus sp. YR651]|nr:hypothetical protein SAMN05216345_102725 [Cupriavidus sp. YR651]SDE04946.1 hypothetical protein SAMN05216345_1442 [Cupriavidus sp. YR651]
MFSCASHHKSVPLKVLNLSAVAEARDRKNAMPAAEQHMAIAAEAQAQ